MHATELGNLTKTIVRFANRKYCKKALINRRELININCGTK